MLISFQGRYQLVGRLREILRVLARHGFYQILRRLSVHRRLSPLERLRYARLHEQEDKSAAIHLREACEELGPSFVEFGQLLSLRRDLIPDPFAAELGRLLTHTRPVPWKVIQKVLPEEFTSPESLFRIIDHQPLASASIAQIYRATLKENAAEVVLKVQRPGIGKLIASDLVVLRWLARLADKYLPESRPLNPIEMVEEFAASIDQELDFMLEATHMDRFSRIFADDEQIRAPKVHWPLTTSKVLVMEYIEGIPIDDMERLRAANIDQEAVAARLLQAFLKKIFLHGFFHADPHPGNFLVQPGNRIVFIDFGLMGFISDDERTALVALFKATLAGDYEQVGTLWLSIASAGAHANPSDFRKGLKKILWKHMNLPSHRINVGEMFLQMVQNGARHGLRLPADLFLMFRTLASIESLLHLLDPQFDVLEHCREFAREQEAAAREPGRLAQATKEEVQQLAATIWRLPGEMEELLKKLADDRLSVDFVHKGLEFLDEELDRSSNRIVVGLIIAALIIGSSLIILAGAGPTLWGLPLYGLTVFAVACILGLIIVVRVLYSGKY
jgi:ubiquinone biosynthesis protein